MMGYTTYYYIYTDSNVIDAVEEIEQKVDQIIIDLTKEKNDRENGDSELTLKINDLIEPVLIEECHPSPLYEDIMKTGIQI